MKTISNLTKLTSTVTIFLALFLQSFSTNAQMSLLVDKSDYNGQNISCHGMNDGWITINPVHAIGNVRYNWTNGDTTSYLTDLTAGLYEVTVSDSFTTQLLSIELIEPSLLTVQTVAPTTLYGFNLICNGDNKGTIFTNVSGGVGKIEYEWSNGSYLSTINNLQAGSYTVTVTDENSCVATSTELLIEPDAVSVNANLISQTTTCTTRNGVAQAIATGGQGLLTFLWDNNETTDIASYLSAGQHAVKAIDTYGCSARADILVTSQDGMTSPSTSNVSLNPNPSTITRGSRTSNRPMILNNDIKNEGVMIQNVENFTENSLLISDMMGNVRVQLQNVKSVNQLNINLERGHYVAVLVYRNENNEMESVTNQISIR